MGNKKLKEIDMSHIVPKRNVRETIIFTTNVSPEDVLRAKKENKIIWLGVHSSEKSKILEQLAEHGIANSIYTFIYEIPDHIDIENYREQWIQNLENCEETSIWHTSAGFKLGLLEDNLKLSLLEDNIKIKKDIV